MDAAPKQHIAAPRDPVARLDVCGITLADKPVLGAVQLDLRHGETLALTGPSGVGKTTLLRILAGLETRFDGTVTRPDRIALVFQEPTLMPWRTARDNLRLVLGISAEQADAALGSVGLADRATHFPRQLSLGQQRRLSLARAFAAKPELILMDEPFVSLDPALADEMMTLFESLRAQSPVTTLIVTHVMSEATRLADRILTLQGQPAQLHDLGGTIQ